MNKRYRFYEIDLLRFVAALSVVLFHYLFRGYAANDMTVLSFPYLGSFAKYGYLGFHLFFIVSGFVILLTAYRKSATNFVISRITRLFPAYWFAVTLTFCTVLLLGAPRYNVNIFQYLVNLSMLQSFVGVKPIDGVYWTLTVELKFYFLIFLTILFGQLKNIKFFLYSWMILTIILTFSDIRYLAFFLFPEWSCYFIAGACFYIIYQEGLSVDKLIIIFCSYVLAVYNSFETIDYLYEKYSVEFSIVLIMIILFSFYLAFFLLALKKSKFMSLNKFFVLGVLTYPLYLIHQNIGFILFNHFHEYGINKYVIFITVMIVMGVASYAIHLKIEQKFSKKLGEYLFKITALLNKSAIKFWG